MKTSGFNFIDLEKENSDMFDIDSIGENLDMNQKPRKKKRKPNFDFLFPSPKNNDNMGMDSINDGKAFEGVI
jgi:hypothetical protein